MNNINHKALFKEIIRILSISFTTIVFALFNIYVAKITSNTTAILASLFILVSIRSVYLASTHYYKFYNHEIDNSKIQNIQSMTEDIRYKNNQRSDNGNNSNQPQHQPKNINNQHPHQPKNINNQQQPNNKAEGNQGSNPQE